MDNKFKSWGYNEYRPTPKNITEMKINASDTIDGALSAMSLRPALPKISDPYKDFHGTMQDIDLLPREMKPIKAKKIVITPNEVIEITMSSMAKNGNRFLDTTSTLPIESVLGTLREHIFDKEKLDVDTALAYKKFKLFRHFLAMLRTRLIGCKGVYNKGLNKVYIVSRDDLDNKDLYNFGGQNLYKGIPAVIGFSKRGIDDAGAIFRTGITASENVSLYNHLVKESGYESPKFSKVVASELSNVDNKMSRGLWTTNKTPLEIANMVISSQDPQTTFDIVASELSPDALQKVMEIIEYGG